MHQLENGSPGAWPLLLQNVADDLIADVAPPFEDAIDTATFGKYRYFWHNTAVIEALVDVAMGRCKRLMVFMPPRHSKSMTLALFVAWVLRYWRGRRVIYTSYNDSLAKKASRLAQIYYRRLGGEYDTGGERANLNNWNTDSMGGMKVGGIGSGLTGEGGDILILDDSVKDARAAQSHVVQQSNWEWFMSTFMTRTNPDFEEGSGTDGASVILVQTLWSDQDIPERITSIEAEMAADPDMADYLTSWRVICLPAIYEGNSRTWPPHFEVLIDPRKIGEALCEQIASVSSLLKKRAGYLARGLAWQWRALFQQDTSEAEGVFISSSWVKPYVKRADIPALSRWFRGWDLAFTADGGDRTVSLLCAIDEHRVRYVIPTTSEQCSPADVRDLIKRVALSDSPHTYVGIERAHAGIAIIDDLKREGPLKGHRIYESVPTKNKVERASNWISLARAGMVKVVAETPAEYIMADELIRSWTKFKGEDGDFDDWVDAMSVVDEMASQVYGEQEKDAKRQMTPLEYFNYVGTTDERRNRSGRSERQPRSADTRPARQKRRIIGG